MLIEEWSKWEPLFQIKDKKYCLDEFVKDTERFFLVLFNEKNSKEKLLVDFTKSPAYFQQKVATSLRVKTLTMLKNNYGDAFVNEWTFFKIMNSKKNGCLLKLALCIILINFNILL